VCSTAFGLGRARCGCGWSRGESNGVFGVCTGAGCEEMEAYKGGEIEREGRGSEPRQGHGGEEVRVGWRCGKRRGDVWDRWSAGERGGVLQRGQGCGLEGQARRSSPGGVSIVRGLLLLLSLCGPCSRSCSGSCTRSRSRACSRAGPVGLASGCGSGLRASGMGNDVRRRQAAAPTGDEAVAERPCCTHVKERLLRRDRGGY
jgi:hypothetical protein